MRALCQTLVRSGVLIFGLAALLAPQPARAGDFAGDVPDLIWIDVGGEYNDVSTDVAVRGPSGLGATINFEDVFDLPGTKTTARMFGSWRISKQRRFIDFGYVDIGRTGSRVLEEDVTYGDSVFKAGGEVHTRFATQFAYAAFRYDFLHEDKVRISGSAGATVMRLVSSVKGEAGFVEDVNNPGVPVTTNFERKVSGAVPVPMVGLNLDWALTKRLVLRTYTRFFRLNLDKFNGGLNESGIRLNWYFVRHFGMGLGYDRTSLNIKELKIDTNIVKAAYIVTGAGIFFNLAW